MELTSADPEPPIGAVVVDSVYRRRWRRSSYGDWMPIDEDGVVEGTRDPESWIRIAGNYGPVTVEK